MSVQQRCLRVPAAGVTLLPISASSGRVLQLCDDESVDLIEERLRGDLLLVFVHP
jgi:hypothetical protein